MIIEIATIVVLGILFIWRFRVVLKSRNYQVGKGYKEITLGKLSIEWDSIAIGIMLLLILIAKKDWSQNSTKNILLIVLIFHFTRIALELILQLIINFNRLAFNEKEILFLGNWKVSIPLAKIQSINLNGWNNKITIKGERIANRISFKKSKISENDIKNFIEFIENNNGFQNIKITDNLKGK